MDACSFVVLLMNKVTLVSYSVRKVMIMIVNIYSTFCGIVDFLSELCMTYSLLKAVGENCIINFCGVTVPSVTGTHKLFCNILIVVYHI